MSTATEPQARIIVVATSHSGSRRGEICVKDWTSDDRPVYVAGCFFCDWYLRSEDQEYLAAKLVGHLRGCRVIEDPADGIEGADTFDGCERPTLEVAS